MGHTVEARQSLDPVRPGEQWFFYWKTSAALWEEKIHEFSRNDVIFIPIYWGLHAEGDGSWDFGNYHPEKDLVRLAQILTRSQMRVCWLLPLTPAPFLPNGGVPITAARTLSISAQGTHLGCIDQDGILHKMYSFFEPKVFLNFASFVQKFGELLAQLNLVSTVWGVDFNYLEDGQPVSFLNDFSIAFEQGLSRYLKKNFPDGVDLGRTDQELKIKQTYLCDLRNLLMGVASEALAPYWGGLQKITVFGAGPKETIERALGSGKTQANYFDDLFSSFRDQRWFSSCLLNANEKKELFITCLSEHFSRNELEIRYNYLNRPKVQDNDFIPFALVDKFDFLNNQVFETNGLNAYLNQEYRWIYYQHDQLNFKPDWIDGSQERVKFFHAAGMDRTLFAQMLKLFLMGQTIIFDKSNLPDELEKRLQIFLLENNLKVQTVNFLSTVSLCELGQGRLIVFQGEMLRESDEKVKFWKNILTYLNLNHPKVHSDEDVYSLWRIRSSASHELSYLDVRRINLYNPTSYKKTVKIDTLKKFAFMKVIDPSNATARTVTEGVEVELLPNGRLALDFGHYEEKV